MTTETPSASRLSAATALVALLASPAASAEQIGVVVRYRTVYEQIDPPVPAGRWSETSTIRLYLDGTGSARIEGLTDRTGVSSGHVSHRDGDVVTFDTYRVVYAIKGADRVSIRSEYPSFTLTRDIRIDGRSCALAVDYRATGGDGPTMRLPNGTQARFRRIFAVEPTCRVEAEAEHDSALSNGCRFVFDEGSKSFGMQVARGATCVGRIGQKFPDRTVTIVSPPRHGRAKIVAPGAVHYVSDGYVGDDHMEVEVRAKTPEGPRTFRRPIDIHAVP